MVRLAAGDRLLLMAVLSAAGTAVALYLTWFFFQTTAGSWCDIDPFWNCTTVKDSVFASVGGIPTATVGVAGFAIMLALSVLPFRGVERIGPWTTDRWLLVFASLGALIGLGLTVIEIFVIHAICVLCMIGWFLDLGILGLAVMPAAD